MSQVYDTVIHNFKGYTPLILIINYWLYFLWYIIYLVARFILNSLYLWTPCPIWPLLTSLSPLVTTGSLPFTCFAHPSSLTLGNCQDILCISEFRFFFFLDSTYKWDHMVFVFLHLTYFTKHSALQGHPCCCKWHIYDFLLVLYILGKNNQ